MRIITKEEAKKLQHKWQVTETEFTALLKAKEIQIEQPKPKAKPKAESKKEYK